MSEGNFGVLIKRAQWPGGDVGEVGLTRRYCKQPSGVVSVEGGMATPSVTKKKLTLQGAYGEIKVS